MVGPESRPRSVTIVSAPGESRPSEAQDEKSNIVSRNVKKICKNLGMIKSVESQDLKSPPSELFRLNSCDGGEGGYRLSVPGDAEMERQQWDNQWEFLMSCISMSVGLGNVWRFPFVAYENGGGAFLIPYMIVLFFVGRPLYFLELALGQFSSAGCVNVWSMVPAMAGVGYGQILGTACITTYYCSLIALSIYYLVNSFYSVFPWTVCNVTNKSEAICIPSGMNVSSFVEYHYPNSTNLNTTLMVAAGTDPSQLNEFSSNVSISSSAEYYFRNEVLKEKADISEGLGLPDSTLALYLVIVWLLLYLTLRKGVSSSGKVAYFTAIFPYLVMLALLIRGLTLPGAGQGLFFFFTPQWEKLASLKVWYAAVTQSFISMSVGLGTLTTYSSYNKFRHNTNRDALIMCFADTFTSLLAGTVTFSILGHLAYELELPLKDVVKSGAMLVFVSYPEVLAKFDFLPQLFAVLFFLMFTTLGLGSAVGILSAVTAAFYDAFPGVNQKSVLKICCCVGYCVGLFYVTPGGMILLGMADHYAATVLLIFFVSAEVIAINWIYGTSRLTRDFNFMLNTKLSVYWRFCWGVLCPILLPLLFFYALYAGAPNLPLGAQIAGWIFAAAGMLLVPAQILYTIFGDTETEADTAISKVIATFRAGNVREKIKNAFLPNNQWGPANMKEREAWQIYCEETNLYQWLPRCIRRKLRSRPSSQDGLPSTENVESY